MIGSWLSGLEQPYNCVSADEDTIYAKTDVYNGSTIVGSNRIAKYIFNSTSLTWGRASYSTLALGGSLAYDGVYLYSFDYFSYVSGGTVHTIRCRIINPDTYNVIATTYITKTGAVSGEIS